MFDQLKIYDENDHFFLSSREILLKVCNAPEKAVRYIIYELST